MCNDKRLMIYQGHQLFLMNISVCIVSLECFYFKIGVISYSLPFNALITNEPCHSWIEGKINYYSGRMLFHEITWNGRMFNVF